MDTGEWLALTKVWWSLDHPLIRKALNAALLRTWVPLVERTVREQVGASGHRGDWCDLQFLTALKRDRRNVRRVADGEHCATSELLLGIAALLKLDVRSFYPHTQEWIAQATAYLLSRPAWHNGHLRPDDEHRARVYAAFRCRHPPRDGSLLTGRDAEWLLEQAEIEERPVIRAVARELGQTLCTLYADTPPAERREYGLVHG